MQLLAVADGRSRQVKKAEIGHAISSCHVDTVDFLNLGWNTIVQTQASLFKRFSCSLRLAPVIDLFNRACLTTCNEIPRTASQPVHPGLAVLGNRSLSQLYSDLVMILIHPLSSLQIRSYLECETYSTGLATLVFHFRYSESRLE
jgi:hypothetical protein